MFKSWLYISILLSLLSFESLGQQYNFKNLSVGDGLAQSQVYSLLKDSRGCIWMGTQGGGLSVYNGLNFSNYGSKNGLPSDFVHSLKEDAKGDVWIGTSKGLCVFDGIHFKEITSPFTNDFLIECIYFTQDSTLLCGTSNGLFSLRNDSLIRFDRKGNGSHQSVYDVVQDSLSQVWLATDNGLVCISENEEKIYTTTSGLGSNLINALEIDSKGTLWVATFGKGVYHFENERFKKVNKIDSEVIFDFKENDGLMWMGTIKSGIIAYHPETKSMTKLTKSSGLPNNQVRCLEIDDWGNLWIGTSGGGVSNYSGKQFQNFSRDNGMPGRQVYSILEDDSLGYWLGNSDLGLVRFYPDSMSSFHVVDKLENTKVKALHQDRKGRVWVGTSGEGVYIIQSDTTIHIGRENGLTADWIKAFEEDSLGHIFVGTSGGGINKIYLDEKNNFSIDFYNRQKSLIGQRITDLEFDQFNRLWFSTKSNGIGVILVDGTVLNFNENSGLISDAIRSLVVDKYGWLWIGSADNGVCRMNLNAEVLEFLSFDGEKLYKSKNIYFLQFDAGSHLWMGTEAGVTQVFLDSMRNPLEWFHYGKEEGFFGIETCTNSSLLDKENNLWFGTIDGMNKTNPSQNIVNTKAPEIRIQEISLFYKPLSETHLASYIEPWGGIRDTLVLTYEQNHLSFDFIGINLPNPNKVKYQWKLNGSEEEWSPLTSKNSISYSNLKPGFYSFSVKACNEDNVCNEIPKTIHFKILAPFWQKTNYQIGFFAICAVLLGGLFFWRIKEIKKKSKEKNDRLNLEKNLIELEQKALRLQMNPHFIFNSLNSIQGLIAKDDPKSARLYLSRFSRLMRQTLENSRETLISIEEEAETLKNYLDLEKFTHNEKFDYSIEMDEESKQFLIPPLLVQPFVENSIIHGVLPKDKEGLIEIKFESKNSFLEVQIKDNGVGRKKAAERNQSKSHYHKSTGIQVTQERVEALSENSEIEYRDLFDSEHNSIGTLVLIKLPKIS